MSIFEKWDSTIDTKGLQEDIVKAKENNGNNKEYEKVPHGQYEVTLDKLELKSTKPESGSKPMVSAWFTILNGKYKNSKLFMNQVVTQGFQIHIVNTFLKSMDTDVNVEFVNYSQYAQMLMDVAEFCDTNKFEFALKYEDNKGFDKFTIMEVFES